MRNKTNVKFLYISDNKSLISMKTNDPLPAGSEIEAYIRENPPPNPPEGYTKPEFVHIYKIGESELFLDFLDDPEEAREAQEYAMEGVERLQAYLSSSELGEPEIEFQIPDTEDGIWEPVLPSFLDDKRIIVKTLRACGVKNHATGIVFYGPLHGNLEIDYVRLEKIKRKREYGLTVKTSHPEEKKPLIVRRYPVLWSVGGSPIDRFACLAFEVLTNRLEDWTSRRVAYYIQEYIQEGHPKDIEPLKYLWGILARAKHEENMVAEGLVKAWLFNVADDIGLNRDDIMAWRPRNSRNIIYENMGEIVKNIQKRGPRIIVNLYTTKPWTSTLLFDDSLDSLYRGQNFD